VRILVVTPFPLFPTSHGGRVRVWGIARALSAAGATVDVVCPWTPAVRPRRFVREGVTIHPHMLPVNVLPLAMGQRLVPPLVMLSWQPFAAGPRQILARFRGYDIAQFHFCANAGWMGREPAGAKVVYVAHNVERDYLTFGPRSLLAPEAAARTVARLEARAVAASDLVVACTEADAQRFRALDGTTKQIVVIPQANDARIPADSETRLRARRELGLADDELALAFVGGPAPHNRAALEFLERSVMTRLQRPARLLAIGAVTRADGARSASSRTIRLGYVEDLSSVLAAADVGVNPVTRGSGANCKVALYLSAGMPVITSEVGLRGYEHLRDECILAEPERFADALEQLALHDGARVRPALLSNWESLAGTLLRSYESLLA
jgi:glycosyltransferase involved in cell wall biosynthesis